jgi:hypothetical protein
MSATGQTICPEFGMSQRGLAYDPITDTYYAGSWNDGVIHQFNTAGEILRSINVNLSIAGLAFHPGSGELFVTHSGAPEQGIFDIYVVDTNTDLLDLVGGFNVALDVDSDGVTDLELVAAAGLDIDCNGNLWAVDQDQQIALGFASGRGDACEWSNVEWLSLDNTTGTIDVESQKSVGLTGLAAGEVGTHTATVVVSNDTPYGALNIPVELTIEQPNYGELGFATTSVSAKNGDAAELTVSRVNGDDFAVSIDYKIIGGTAEADVHYVVSEGTLSWADYESGDKVITIETLDVDLDTQAVFVVELDNAHMAAVLDTTASVTIEPDNLGVVAMELPRVYYDEDAGVAEISVSRSGGSDRAISVNYSVLGASATTADFNNASGTVEWADGDSSSKTITVSIVDDSEYEPEESFNVVLSSDTIELGSTVTAIVINENDKKDSGSFGIFATLLLMGAMYRRRKTIH